MKTNQFIFAALVAAFLSVASFAAAQVTIGGSDAPKAGAILDLNSSVKGGLQLSNVSITDLGKIPVGFPGITIPGDVTDEVKAKLTGAIVYNTYEGLQIASQDAGVAKFGKGIYVWNGNQWNTIGEPEHAIIFAPYNLGVDITKFNDGDYLNLSPAKRQIKYLATCSTADAVYVWGDNYQWGRAADGHEKSDAVAYGGDGNTNNQGALGTTDLDAATGQVKQDYVTGDYDKNSTTQKHGHFIKVNAAPNDWRTPQKDDLWGNGEGLISQVSDNQGAVLYNGEYYQNTDWAIPANNPCASMGDGWRVPTQDELERLCNYDGNPGTVASSFLTSSSGTATTPNSAPLTWVPVAGGIASDSWADSQYNLGGYAIYKTADWTSAIGANGYFDDNGTPDYNRPLYAAAAPEPILFFPATPYRSHVDGVFTNAGIRGGYWSSTVEGKQAHYLYFTNNSISPYNNMRAFGFSVRCVKSL
ncbi:MAG: fibrobacter succinogenes major paralogous domain-containing protein [Prevotellaceae bacterium]|nr:fibrobacter succinogenes major paralogous domain-containing protein [Prevotellaceae bacterium]